jgi:pyruvate-formate lyase-activating enzyme
MPHVLAASAILARRGGRTCWESNGTMHPRLLDAALRYSLETGGCVNYDLIADKVRFLLAIGQLPRENYRTTSAVGQRS